MSDWDVQYLQSAGDYFVIMWLWVSLVWPIHSLDITCWYLLLWRSGHGLMVNLIKRNLLDNSFLPSFFVPRVFNIVFALFIVSCLDIMCAFFIIRGSIILQNEVCKFIISFVSWISYMAWNPMSLEYMIYCNNVWVFCLSMFQRCQNACTISKDVWFIFNTT